MFSELSRFEQWMPAVAPEQLTDLDERLRIFEDRSIEVWYSPHGRQPERPAVWLLGITPGWQQTRIAYAGASRAMERGMDAAAAAALRKPDVAFAGSMRANLVAMLDELGLPQQLGVGRSLDLFGSDQLRTGSVLRFPVFRAGKNYNGHSPGLLTHPVLREMVDVVLAKELATVPDCLIVPLGNAAESALRYSIEKDRLDDRQVLFGLPHPSGANGHRTGQFRDSKDRLKAGLAAWFDQAKARTD